MLYLGTLYYFTIVQILGLIHIKVEQKVKSLNLENAGEHLGMNNILLLITFYQLIQYLVKSFIVMDITDKVISGINTTLKTVQSSDSNISDDLFFEIGEHYFAVVQIFGLVHLRVKQKMKSKNLRFVEGFKYHTTRTKMSKY